MDGPVIELVARLLAAARAELGDAAAYLEPVRVTETRAGVEIRG